MPPNAPPETPKKRRALRRESKWTSLAPQNREKHFVLLRLLVDSHGVPSAELRALISGRCQLVPQAELADETRWSTDWT